MTARIPHPFFFDQDRQISGAQGDLRREETAVHLQVIWVASVKEALDLQVFGGPTFFDVKQDLVTDVLFTQVYPYDTATFTGLTTGNQSESTIGFNVETVEYQNVSFTFWDVGGKDKIRLFF